MEKLSPLLVAKLERDAWKETEKLSRAFRDRKVHALAVKRVKEIAVQMMDIARDELYDEESDDDGEQRERKEDEEGFLV